MKSTSHSLHKTHQVAIFDEVWQLLKLAIPIIIALISQIAIGFVDIIMLGRYNELHFAAGSLGANLIIFSNLIAVGLLMGIQPLIAHAIGSNNDKLVKEYFQQGVWIAFIVAILLTVFAYYSDFILHLLEIESSLQSLTNDYLHTASFSLIFISFYLVPRYVSEAIEHSMPMMMIQLLLIPLNVLGNYCFIFGNFGFEEKGAEGAALASVLVNIIGCILLWAYLICIKYYQKYSLFDNFSKPDIKLIKTILLLSIPIALTMMFENALFTATLLFMGKYGATAVAAHEIAINYAATMFMVPLGISMAITVKVGNAVGRGDIAYAQMRGNIGIVMATIFMMFSATIIFFFHHGIARIYTNYEHIIELAVQLLILAGIFQVVDGVQVAMVGVLRGLKDTKIPMLLTFISYWPVGFSASILFSFYFGFKESGLWYGLIGGLSVAAILLSFRMRKVFKIMHKKI